jgi:hypothetical protein
MSPGIQVEDQVNRVLRGRRWLARRYPAAWFDVHGVNKGAIGVEQAAAAKDRHLVD